MDWFDCSRKETQVDWLGEMNGIIRVGAGGGCDVNPW
jgi:hypothetical protein